MAVCLDTITIKWPFARVCTSKKVVCDLHSSCILEMETGVMVLRVIFERCFNVAINMCVLEWNVCMRLHCMHVRVIVERHTLHYPHMHDYLFDSS